MKLTAEEVYEKLLNDDKILTKKGQISFQLGDISIIVKQKDVVGNIMQEWVEGWLKKNGIDYALDNSQMPPDFYLDPDDRKKNLLEIKAFNYKASPAFDIADFTMYEQEVKEKPWMLDVTYLIFGYAMSDDGVVTIKRMWKQKVWEITRPMLSGKNKTPWPLNLQIKKGKVHKIRPGKWYTKPRQFKMYETKEDFLSAIEETVYQNVDTRSDGPDWRYGFLKNYQKYYGEKLAIPRWTDIADNYIVKKK